jgi:hypothetical protein
MPFVSKKQNAWAHTKNGTKALGGKAKVKEWESATDYKNIPTKKHSKDMKRRLSSAGKKRTLLKR